MPSKITVSSSARLPENQLDGLSPTLKSFTEHNQRQILYVRRGA
jgi:hypothetical protein